MQNIKSERICILVFVSICIMMASCNTNSKKVFTHQVKHLNYKDQVQLIGELQPARTLTISCPRLRTDATISYLIKHGTKVQKGDTICILEAKEIEGRYEDAVSELKSAKAELEKTKAQQRLNTQLLIAQKESIEANVKISQLDSIQKKFVSNVNQQLIDLELKKANLEKQKVENRLKSLEKINKSELNQKKIKIKQAEMKMSSSKSLLDQLTIKAPEAGMVLRAKQWGGQTYVNEGDIVWGNRPLLQMPSTSAYQVKFFLSEGEYKLIEKDNALQARPNASAYLQGKIKSKAPVGKPIEKGSQVKVFEVVATVDSINFEPKPGQNIMCNITTKEIDNACLLPLMTVFHEDSSTVVYVSNKNKFERRPIHITYKNATEVVVKEGLQAKDFVALTKPEKSLIMKNHVSNE